MAEMPSSAAARASRRRREDALIARAEAILLRRLKRSGRLENPRHAERFLRLRLAGLPHEELHAVWLDAQHRIIACEILAKGGADRAQLDPRVVVHSALQRSARAVILAHNHPSGEATPSDSDIKVTRDLIRAGQLLKIEVLDHVIIGNGQRVSLRELGYFYS